MNHAYYCCCCFLLHLTATTGSGQTKCTATADGTLMCQFAENVKSTQRDFSIYFDPVNGSEDLLVACSWVRSQLHCITQEGFKWDLVSETAVITIPTNFLSINGSYRCESVGHPFNAASCRVPARGDVQRFANCEAKSTFDDNPLSLNCSFNFAVKGFSVIYNETALAEYTKSSCKKSHHVCHYKAEEGKMIFTLTLNTTKNLYGEFVCLPDNSSDGIEVKSCIVAMEKPAEVWTQDSSVSSVVLIAVVCPILLVILTTALVVLVVLHRRKRGRKEENRGKIRGFQKRLLPDTGTEVLQFQERVEIGQ